MSLESCGTDSSLVSSTYSAKARDISTLNLSPLCSPIRQHLLSLVGSISLHISRSGLLRLQREPLSSHLNLVHHYLCVSVQLAHSEIILKLQLVVKVESSVRHGHALLSYEGLCPCWRPWALQSTCLVLSVSTDVMWDGLPLCYYYYGFSYVSYSKTCIAFAT